MSPRSLASPRPSSRAPLIGLAVLVAAALAVAPFGSRILISLLAQAAIMAFLAFGVGFLSRTLGLVSFGHAAPFGLGAYGTAWALSPAAPLPPDIGLLIVVPAVFAIFLAIGVVVSRIEGIAFGMLTLALGQAVYVAASKFRGLTGGADGMMVNLPRRLFGLPADAAQSPQGMFSIAVIGLALVFLGLRWFERTPTGRLAVAIRENEERARFLGYRTHALKAAVFALSATIAAIGGCLFALYQGFVSPEIVHWSFSGQALIMAILGGNALLWGPVAGAFAFFFFREALTEWTTHWLAVLGATLIAVTVAWPAGLSGAAERLIGRKARAAAGTEGR